MGYGGRERLWGRVWGERQEKVPGRLRKGEEDTEDMGYGQSQAGSQPSMGRKGGSQHGQRVTKGQALCSMWGYSLEKTRACGKH